MLPSPTSNHCGVTPVLMGVLTSQQSPGLCCTACLQPATAMTASHPFAFPRSATPCPFTPSSLRPSLVPLLSRPQPMLPHPVPSNPLHPFFPLLPKTTNPDPQGEIKKLQDAAAKQEKARAALRQQVEDINASLMSGAQVGHTAFDGPAAGCIACDWQHRGC